MVDVIYTERTGKLSIHKMQVGRGDMSCERYRKKKKILYTNMSQTTPRIREADTPILDFMLTQNRLEVRSLTCGSPLMRSDHTVLELEYAVSEQMTEG